MGAPTTDQRDRIESIIKSGLNTKEAARALGLSERSVLRWQLRLGLREPKPAPVLEEGWEERAEALLEEGAPYSAVSDILGVSRSRIRKTFPGRGMSLHDAGVMGYAHLKEARDRKQAKERRQQLTRV